MTEIGPQPGPQTAFLACDADIAFYGGAANSGKTRAAIMAAMQWSDVPGYAAVIFRRTAPELVGGGSVWEESQGIGRALHGVPVRSPNLEWRFPSSATVELRHLQHDGDVYGHQGKRYAAILFEEVTHFTEFQFWYLYGRLGTTCGVRAHLRATCNPDPDSFVRTLIDWWIDADGYAIPERSGVLRWLVRDDNGKLRWFADRETAAEYATTLGKEPTSLTFIPAKLSDNKLGDPQYGAKLDALPLVQRMRLKGGNWNARSGAGTILRREWFVVVDEPPCPIVATARGWDKAATEEPGEGEAGDPDWTKGAKWSLLEDGSRYLSDMNAIRARPAGVFDRMRLIAAQDGPGVPISIWQDPGQAGIVDVEATQRELLGHRIVVTRAAKSKVVYANEWAVIAERGWAAAEAIAAETVSGGRVETKALPRVYVQRAPWTDAFLASCDAFDGSGRGHDDDIDAVSAAEQALPTSGAAGIYRPPTGWGVQRPWDAGRGVGPRPSGKPW